MKIDIEKEVNKLLKAKMNKLKKEIYERTKQGYGVDSEGASKSSLKPLSTSYKAARKNMALGKGTSASKSNLTKSGDMLDDISVSVKGTTITLSLGSGESKQKATWQSAEGRTFMNLDNEQLANLSKELQKEILDYITINILL